MSSRSSTTSTATMVTSGATSVASSANSRPNSTPVATSARAPSKATKSKYRPRLHPSELSSKIEKFFSPILFPRAPDRAPVLPSLSRSKLAPACPDADKGSAPTWRIRRFKKWRDQVPELRLVLLDPRRRGHMLRYQTYALPFPTTWQRGVKRKIFPRGREIKDYSDWPSLAAIKTRRAAAIKASTAPPPPTPGTSTPATKGSGLPQKPPVPAKPHMTGPERRKERVRLKQHRWVLYAENERRWRKGMREVMRGIVHFQEGAMLEPDKWQDGKGVWLPDFDPDEVTNMTRMFRDVRRDPSLVYTMSTNIEPVKGRAEAEAALRKNEAERQARKEDRRKQRDAKKGVTTPAVPDTTNQQPDGLKVNTPKTVPAAVEAKVTKKTKRVSGATDSQLGIDEVRPAKVGPGTTQKPRALAEDGPGGNTIAVKAPTPGLGPRVSRSQRKIGPATEAEAKRRSQRAEVSSRTDLSSQPLVDAGVASTSRAPRSGVKPPARLSYDVPNAPKITTFPSSSQDTVEAAQHDIFKLLAQMAKLQIKRDKAIRDEGRLVQQLAKTSTTHTPGKAKLDAISEGTPAGSKANGSADPSVTLRSYTGREMDRRARLRSKAQRVVALADVGTATHNPPSMPSLASSDSTDPTVRPPRLGSLCQDDDTRQLTTPPSTTSGISTPISLVLDDMVRDDEQLDMAMLDRYLKSTFRLSKSDQVDDDGGSDDEVEYVSLSGEGDTARTGSVVDTYQSC